MVSFCSAERSSQKRSSKREEQVGQTVQEAPSQRSIGSWSRHNRKRGYTRKELQTFPRFHGVDTFEEKQGVIGGWEGNAKGLLHVMYERGMISEELLDKYALDGRQNAMTGEIDLQLSLRHLMAECVDFKYEETALQYLGTHLGVTVELTPKFHAELSGKDVE